MDARRRDAAVTRVETEMQALLRHQAREHPGPEPCVVIVHRSAWVRARLRHEFDLLAINVFGESDDGAQGLALALVGQPELLVLEDKLPWVSASDLVANVRCFSSHTTVIVHAEHSGAADDLLALGARAVLGRATPLSELADHAHQLLSAA